MTVEVRPAGVQPRNTTRTGWTFLSNHNEEVNNTVKYTISGDFEYDERTVELVTIIECWKVLSTELSECRSEYGKGSDAYRALEHACDTLMLRHYQMAKELCPDPSKCEGEMHLWRYRSYKNGPARPYYYKSTTPWRKLVHPDMRLCTGATRSNRFIIAI